jgi:hypothetical protein
VQRADHTVEQGELRHLAPRHGEDAADQQRLDVLAALRARSTTSTAAAAETA